MFTKQNMVASAFILLCSTGMPVMASQLNLYKVEKRTVEVDNAATEIYQVADMTELKSSGNDIYSSGSITLDEGSLWVIGSVYPRLYPQNSDGTYDYTRTPSVNTMSEGGISVYSETDRTEGKTAIVYSVPIATKGTMLITCPRTGVAEYKLAAPVYFKYLEREYNASKVAYNFTTTESIEMYTTDGVTYRIDRLEMYKDQYFNIGRDGDFSTTIKENLVSKIANDEEFEFPSSGVAETSSELVGSAEIRMEGDMIMATLISANPAPVFLSITNNSSVTKPASYLEFSVNEEKQIFDYDYVLEVPVVTGGKNADQAIVITSSLPKVGKTLHNSSSAVEITTDDIAVEGKSEKPGKEILFEYSLDLGKRYVFADGNFHGKIYLSAQKDAEGEIVKNAWVGKVVVSRSADDIMKEFESNNELLDNEVNGIYPLRYSSKPILHDNAAYKTETKISVPNPKNEYSTEHDLVYMETRHALTGVDCNINRVAGGSLASVVNVQTNLGNMMGSDLYEAAEFVGVANVKLATAPLVSVRDEKHYYSRGTEAGFNLASGSGTNVLSLSVIETLSLAFYRDGELLAVVPASAQSGKGVDLALISISSDKGSYDIKAVAPVVFDEVCLYNSGGLKLEVGNALKVNYAFVGKEENSEILLGSVGRAAYNSQMKEAGKDYELYVQSYSTVAHISGGVVKDGDTVSSAFVGNESDSENLTNILSLATLGMGWAEMKLDAVGKDAPADHEQLFKAGSRVNFKLTSTKVLNLGVGTGNTITFFTRKNVVRNDDGSIKSVDWDKTQQVLSATVLQLGVVEIAGEQYVSMIAPCDFSGIRLDINDGLLNLGGTDIYYASITPQPTVPHKCELNIPSKIFLGKTRVTYYAPYMGQMVPWRSEYEDIKTYTPDWDKEVAPMLEWSFEKDENGNPFIPKDSQVELDPQTGTLRNIDMEGEYVLRYKIHEETATDNHVNCEEIVSYIVDRRATSDADDDEIRSIIGDGIILQNNSEGEETGKYAISLDTHGVTTGQLVEISNALNDPQNVLDGKLSTYATAKKGLSVAQNNIMIGVRTTDKSKFGTDDGTGHLKYPVRIGFIVEENSSLLGLNAVNYLQMRAYDGSGNDTEICRQLIDENATVGADLIGVNTIYKKRYSILVEAGTKLFDEFSLWNCGVADINLNEIRIYGAYVDEIEKGSTNYNWAVGNRHDLIWKDATAVPMNVGVVDASSSVLMNLDFMIDNDLETAFVMGNGLGVGAGTKLRIELGRVVTPNEKIGLIMGNEISPVQLSAGDWMKVRLYGPVSSSISNGSPRKIVSSDIAHTEMTDWKVLGAEVAGYADRKAIYITPRANTSAIEIELGDIATAGDNNRIYGITVAPRPESNFRSEMQIPTGVEGFTNDFNSCHVSVDRYGHALVEARCDIKDVRVNLIDGIKVPCGAVISGNTAEIRLGQGVNVIQITMTDGTAHVVKVII